MWASQPGIAENQTAVFFETDQKERHENCPSSLSRIRSISCTGRLRDVIAHHHGNSAATHQSGSRAVIYIRSA
jgi:hypothetical protein